MDSLGGSIGGAPSLLQALAAQAPMMAIGQALGGQGPTAGGLLGLAMQMDAQRVKDAYTMAKDRREEERLNLAQQTAARQADTEARKVENDRFGHVIKMGDLTNSLLSQADAPDTRAALVNQLDQIYQQVGMPGMTPGVKQGLIDRRLTPDREKEVATFLLASADDQGQIAPEALTAAAQRFGLSPQDAAYIGQGVTNDRWLKARNLPSSTDMLENANKLRDAEAKRQQDEIHRKMEALGFRPNTEEYVQGLRLWQGATQGQRGNLWDQDPKDPATIRAVAQIKQEATNEALKVKQQEFNMQEQMRSRLQDQRDAQLQAREWARQDLKEQQRTSKTVPYPVFDIAGRRLRQPTVAEVEANPDNFRKPMGQEPRQFQLLAEGMPKLKQTEQLIEELLVDHAPANLLNALSGKVSTKLGTDPKWRVLDENVTGLTALFTNVYGPGQFRTQLYNTLKNVAPKFQDTRQVGRAITEVMTTDLENRMTGILTGGDLTKLKPLPMPLSKAQTQALLKQGFSIEKIREMGDIPYVEGPLTPRQ